MALFGLSKTKTTLSKKIRPTVVKTQHVPRELLNLANLYGVSADKLDFNILEIQTFIRVNKDTQETDWEEMTPFELYEIDDKTALLNPNFQIKQVYEVEFIAKDTENDLYSDFHSAVGVNGSKCKVYLSIKEGSVLNYNPSIKEDLRLLINKKKIRAGILVNIFDEMLEDTISKMSATIQVQESVRFDKNETILIAQSIEPTKTLHDELILHYDKKEDIDDNTRINYAKRGFIRGVNKDELLIEYIKAQKGKPGRNCKGEFLKPKEPETINTPTFQINDTIIKKETSRNIEYRANENGYIALEGNMYLIKSEMDVSEISFKATGDINASLDSDVTMVVTEADAIKDAIGSGVNVEISEITVEGNVGSKAKVNAIKATIEGQTHRTAQVRADVLRINAHKGAAFGKNIMITRLEHGTVEGDIVSISQAMGGKIRAKEITIELCNSNVHATASRFIEINKLEGQENIFTIDPLLKRDDNEKVRDNKDDIKDLRRSINDIKVEIQKYQQLVKENTPAFNDLKKRLLHYKKNGVKMPSSFVKKYKQFQKIKEHLNSIIDENIKKSDQLTLLTTKTASFQDNIFDARIINRDKWVGHNELKFKLVDPPIELSYNPPEGSPNMIFGLVEIDEGIYEIEAVAE